MYDLATLLDRLPIVRSSSMMARLPIALAVACFLAPSIRAQDMPLAQIVVDGEGWKKSSGQRHAPEFAYTSILDGKASSSREEYSIGTRKFYLINKDGVEPSATNRPVPTAGFVSRDGGTVFVGRNRGYIWAYPAKADGTLLPGQPYCPIRVRMDDGKLELNDSPGLVSSITGDKDGRIYAATPLGIQVFDPTGRLCGVLAAAAPGKPECMAFEADKLTLWIGDVKYERKLNARGLQP
jgi:sugar lactone lactonase YvrE